MKATASRFDLDALRQIAGAKVFVRGDAYFRDGHVRLLMVEKKRIVADVAGTEDYRTIVTGSGASFDGECSCPAFRTGAYASTWSPWRSPPTRPGRVLWPTMPAS